ncbi:transmembrane protein 184C-like [Mus pahari]|uniref:transmembrane protein 184C-like n=1 Tax=Mus pahari TaxID=10093 RepID=UPI00111481B6|nr:transmembrane protein 184C-like [Mus pahari]
MRGYQKTKCFPGDPSHTEHSSLLSSSSQDMTSDSSKVPSPVGLYQGFGYTIMSHSSISILNDIPEEQQKLLNSEQDVTINIPEEQQKLLDIGKDVMIDIPEEQQKLLDTGKNVMIDIPEQEKEIPGNSQYQDHVQTVTSQASTDTSEDSMSDISESQQETSNSFMDSYS